MKHRNLLFVLCLFLCPVHSFAQIPMLTATQEKIVQGFVKEGNSYLIEHIIPVDLDKDGSNEAIVIYFYGAHSSGAKVIKFSGNNGTVIFEHENGTPVTEFKILGNIPTLIFEESNYTPTYAEGARFKTLYKWDGTTFINK